MRAPTTLAAYAEFARYLEQGLAGLASRGVFREESFFATLECELLDRQRFRTQAEARMAVFDFIESFYNPRRRHSALGFRSPVNFEREHGAAA